MKTSIRKYENLHIAFWLVKDTCWVMDLHVLGIIMILPTLSPAIYITLKSKSSLSEAFHNLAVCFWILANSTWMTGEFFFNDTLRPYATGFFITGLVIIAYYYLFLVKRALPVNNNSSILETNTIHNR
ncbi:MAG TPA: hypothetical protein VNI52_06710 [Sphingobacteriaceae bacterium]|nr:hypothetical protein [Sphingobacteriaceae bacterium]